MGKLSVGSLFRLTDGAYFSDIFQAVADISYGIELSSPIMML